MPWDRGEALEKRIAELERNSSTSSKSLDRQGEFYQPTQTKTQKPVSKT